MERTCYNTNVLTQRYGRTKKKNVIVCRISCKVYMAWMMQREIFNQKRVEEMLGGVSNMGAKVALIWMSYDVVLYCGAASIGDYCTTFRNKATLPRNVVLQSVSDTASYPRRKNSTLPL